MKRNDERITWEHHSMPTYSTWELILAMLAASIMAGGFVAVVLAVLP